MKYNFNSKKFVKAILTIVVVITMLVGAYILGSVYREKVSAENKYNDLLVEYAESTKTLAFRKNNIFLYRKGDFVL